MKANHHARTVLEDKRAQVGIGTMIVFIASVLVAAIAAAVLLDVSGSLQERSSRTGKDATEQVSSNLVVKSLFGARDDNSVPELETMLIQVQLAPGSAQMDLMQLIVEISNGEDHAHVDFDAFEVEALRDTLGAFDPTSPVMSRGDLVQITIDLDAQDMTITPRQEFGIRLIPEVGVHVHADFHAPSSFGTNKVVRLR